MKEADRERDTIYFDDGTDWETAPGQGDLIETAILKNLRTVRVKSLYGSIGTVVTSRVSLILRRTAESIQACKDQEEEEAQPWE